MKTIHAIRCSAEILNIQFVCKLKILRKAKFRENVDVRKNGSMHVSSIVSAYPKNVRGCTSMAVELLRLSIFNDPPALGLFTRVRSYSQIYVPLNISWSLADGPFYIECPVCNTLTKYLTPPFNPSTLFYRASPRQR